jgi:16S rRNA processing protein RimM
MSGRAAEKPGEGMSNRTKGRTEHEPLAVGKVVKAFGIRGELVARCYAGDPSRFTALRSVLVGREPGQARDIRIERVRADERGVCLKLAGVDDRNAAEKLVGHLLFVEHGQRVKLPRGTYFVHEIIGLAVLNQDGANVGRVRDVLKLPAHDVYVIERHGRDIMIPAVQEFVLGVDLEKGVMRVRLIDGMVEE